jgi:ribulose-phosphate 3-epimerase
MIKVAPSILSADFSNLEQEIRALSKAGADMIHIDVMDGHFVPNLTFGPGFIKSIRPHTDLPFEVHLMITNPEKYISDYIKAGADIIIIHLEATDYFDSALEQIRNGGAQAGIALLPSTSPNVIDSIINNGKSRFWRPEFHERPAG